MSAMWSSASRQYRSQIGGAFGLAPPVGAVPEPGTWAMMIFGFGMAGTAMRVRAIRACKLMGTIKAD
jgi:hypothetical protein